MRQDSSDQIGYHGRPYPRTGATELKPPPGRLRAGTLLLAPADPHGVAQLWQPEDGAGRLRKVQLRRLQGARVRSQSPRTDGKW